MRTIKLMNKKHHAGVDHINAIALYKLGLEQVISEEFASAEENLQKALDLMENEESIDSETKTICRRRLGESLLGQDSFSEALPHLDQAHNDMLETYGKNNIETADVANNLGLVFLRIGEYSKAEKLFHESLEVNIEHWGDEHPETAKNLLQFCTATVGARRPTAK